jgi:hypothetical protein
MDQRERAADPFEVMRAALDGRQTRLWTALPGLIQSFDPDAMTCEVQPAVKGRVTTQKGATSFVDLPLLVDCPVVFPGGGGVTLTFPIQAGDECLVVFASRCIDAWWQQGGSQPPMEARMHDLSDGFVLPGVRSQPRKINDLSTSRAQLRNDAGDTFVELDPAGKAVTITAPSGATINADVTINGTLHVTGQITSDADVVTGSISLKNHVHPGVTAGSADTEAPTG